LVKIGPEYGVLYVTTQVHFFSFTATGGLTIRRKVTPNTKKKVLLFFHGNEFNIYIVGNDTSLNNVSSWYFCSCTVEQWGTALQAGRSLGQFPIVSMESFRPY
jgi:hypothetical protein